MKAYYLSLVALALGAASMTNASAASIFNGAQGPAMINTVSMAAAAASASSNNINSAPSTVQAMNASDPGTSANAASAASVSGNASSNGQQPALLNRNSSTSSTTLAQ